ncbi:hypothetical protein LIER_11294 [Lithospermum erythrorhizon]|uniref:Ethylene-responsive nuclear protein n=1 Tax=Lithospermum erythrorhizon TaxID=34254 RepID=A0AAV3PPF9_LITER
MNSSWKKVKSGKLPQLLSDRISERRRRGAESPLVVETGFPTSIIDLFVKNKDKLKNPLLKKHSKNNSRILGNDCNYVIDNVPSSPPPTLSVSPINRFSSDGGGDVGDGGAVVEYETPPSLSALSMNQFLGDGGVVVGDVGMVVEDERCGGNLVSLAVFGLFLVVVLALGTKMFVVGITFAAFVLMFLEYLVKQQLITPPCIESKEIINSMVKKVMGFMRIQKGSSVESNSASKPVIEIEEEQGRSESRRVVEETEIKHNEIVSEKEKIGDRDEKIEVLYIKDIIRAEAREECRTRKSRGAKMRVKMREFLPKRLRKKKTKDVDVGVVDKVSVVEEEDSHRELSSGGGSCLSSISRDVEELVELSINQNEEEATTQPIEHRSSSYVALVVIVLVGLLVGGRVLALILTVSWCLLLKSGGTIGGRCIKPSIFRSPA